ncbi:MAG: alpha/beta hydrolase [Candidatus Hydrogenedentes bacterium]|jgi:acylglycerol lipase|nr:alpha/beta hydrolase [Candidatus Hydrogenedentota bacterium]
MFKDGWFEVSETLRLYERRLVPTETPLANVVIIHGYGDHCTRYAWTMERFVEAGLATFTYDQRGHGRSPGKRGYIYQFEHLLDDLGLFLTHLQEDLAPVPLFLLGHSMGGMVLARYMQTRTVETQGLVFSSPFLAFSDNLPKCIVALGPIIARILPCAPIGKVNNKGLSRDSSVIEATNNDPLSYHGRVAAHTASEFYRIIEEVEEDLEKITQPMLVLHGGADHVVSPSGSEMLYKGAASVDKELRIYSDGYHELFNDLEKEQYVSEIVTWIKSRI